MSDIYEQLTSIYYQLIDKAHDARAASYSPYSGIAVGAALLASSGKIYLGANIENASYSPTICAERVAFFKAVNAGERDFVAIAVVGAPANEEPSSTFPPCGVCRQVMSEFCGPDFMVVLGTRSDMRLIPFSEILPHSFTKENLEPSDNLQSGTILTPHGEEPQAYTFDEEYEEDLDPDEFFDDENLHDDLDDDFDDDEDSDEEEEESGEGEFLDLTPKPQSEPRIFEFDDAENLHELEDRWEI
jgi:cytidine deaminase